MPIAIAHCPGIEPFYHGFNPRIGIYCPGTAKRRNSKDEKVKVAKMKTRKLEDEDDSARFRPTTTRKFDETVRVRKTKTKSCDEVTS